MAKRKKKERKHKTGTPFAGARRGLRHIRPKVEEPAPKKRTR